MLFSQSYNLLPTAMNTECDFSPPPIDLDFLDLDINDSNSTLKHYLENSYLINLFLSNPLNMFY